MTEELNLEEIRKRAEAATPGPWEQRAREFDDWGTIRGPAGKDGYRWATALARAGYPTTADEENHHRRLGTDPYEHNARFIAHARTDIPALLELVATLRAEVARLQAENAELRRTLAAITDSQPKEE